MPWIWGSSGFTSSSTAEDVTRRIDATGVTAIVTGGTSGIGTNTVRVLALRGARVTMPARNMESGHRVKEVILKDNPNAKVDVMELDLSSLNSVRRFSASFKSWNQPLNILINNARIMECPFQLSEDGIGIHFATNHLEYKVHNGAKLLCSTKLSMQNSSCPPSKYGVPFSQLSITYSNTKRTPFCRMP